MKIKEYNQMMAYLTREARNPTPRVDFKLAETGRELSKDYADGRLVRPKNIKDKFPKVMFDKSTNKNTEKFIQFLVSKNIIVNLRKSKGKDIDAACGQLVNKLN